MEAHEELNCERERKRRRSNTRKKLPVNTRVEVRSFVEGFLGSWHSGTVMGCRHRTRLVKFDHVLTDDASESLVGWVDISSIIDHANETSCMHRGHIRPTPPTRDRAKWRFYYGLCVDALYKDAWWEGVIFDQDYGSEEKRVFFPDSGEELTFPINMLRVTLDWNEATEDWWRRGRWLFLELIEEYEKKLSLFVSIEQIWHDVCEKKRFMKAGEWTSPVESVWRCMVVEAIEERCDINVKESISSLDSSKSELCDPQALGCMPLNLLDPPSSNSEYLDGLDCYDVSFAEITACFPLPDWLDFPSHLDIASICSEVPAAPLPSKIISDTKTERWAPVGIEFCPGAELCPGAVTEYAQDCKQRKNKFPRSLITSVRKHLSYLGWRMELKVGMHGKGMSRVRYISPDGSLYYSLRLVCEALCRTSDSSNRSEVLPSSKLNWVVVEPAYCPQAARDWYLRGEVGHQGHETEKSPENAKQHLAFLGWSFWYADKGNRRELRYRSPSGKIFYSLRTACKCCLDGGSLRLESLPPPGLGGP